MPTKTRLNKKSLNISRAKLSRPSSLASSYTVPVQTELDERSPQTLAQLKAQREKQETRGHDYLHNISFENSNSRSNLYSVQPKLTIGQPNDKYEQEADQVASQVVNNINNPSQVAQKQETPEEEVQTKPLSESIQRQEEREEEELARKPLPESLQRQINEEDEGEEEVMPKLESIQRQPMEEEEEMMQPKLESLQRQEEEEEEVQPKSTGGTQANASLGLEQSIQQARGNGQGLDHNIRQPMENAFGVDFSGVRVHTDSTSDMMNRSIQARAFTTGQDVFFRQGEYNPSNRGGQELLAHELTHVVQQTGGITKKPVQKKKILI
jgi:hypothetical protein